VALIARDRVLKCCIADNSASRTSGSTRRYQINNGSPKNHQGAAYLYTELFLNLTKLYIEIGNKINGARALQGSRHLFEILFKLFKIVKMTTLQYFWDDYRRIATSH
jgi:hypothetical protein